MFTPKSLVLIKGKVDDIHVLNGSKKKPYSHGHNSRQLLGGVYLLVKLQAVTPTKLTKS